MTGMTWYARNSQRALKGMHDLSLEQRGAYNTLLDLIYASGAPIRDDDRLLAGHMNVSVRKWRALRQSLLDAARIVVRETPRGRFLSDETAEEELEAQKFRRDKCGESGSKGGRKSAEARAKANENNGPAQATATANAQANAQANSKHIDIYSVPNGTEADGLAEAKPKADPNKEPWDRATALLVARGRLKDAAARKFFGKLLRDHGLPASSLLPSIVTAEMNGTADPQGYLTKAARAVSARRGDGQAPPESRFVAWDAETWRTAVETYRSDGRWDDAIGPCPGNPGCRAPQTVLRDLGYPTSEAA